MSTNTESHLVENRIFPPSKEFSEAGRIKSFEEYKEKWQASVKDPAAFWAEEAAELQWQQPWSQTLEWKEPYARWFIGGKLNVSENCIDRHLSTARKNKAAIIFEGEPGDKQIITYQQLYKDVCRFANVLKRNGVEKGDRVLIYMPMIPEAAVAMLACTRIGAVHSVVFGGYSSDSIKDRLGDCGATVVITADGGYRRGSIVPLKKNVDEALKTYDGEIKKVIVHRRTQCEVTMAEGRDVWWHEELECVDAKCEPAKVDAEDPIFILYTSGSTGKPKGVLHSTAGYLTGTYATTKYIFDLKEDDIFWCTADVGWITGHSYVVYGPLANGATVFMYEGAPNWPENDRFWRLIEEYGITVFYTAPTAIRAFIKWGEEWPNKHDLSSLRLLGSVGEPINPEAWIWYHNVIGKGRCPIVDTWWQTETGSILISPIPSAIPTKPGSATLPFFGIDAAVVDDEGNEVGTNVSGKLIVRHPWPSMLRTVYNDDKRYEETYWGLIPNVYTAGDEARRDEDGYLWVVGRIDDVLNVAGHRLGTSEIEGALVSHEAVAEAAAVGRPDEIKGQGIVVFVTLKEGVAASPELRDALRKHVANTIGAIARPDDIRFTDALPKTRSGKIMRRLLKQVAAGDKITGDTTTLEDFTILAKLAASSGSDDDE